MDDWTKKHLQFKRITDAPLSELEQLLKNAFEEQFTTTKVELIRIREPLPFDDPDILDIAYVFSYEKDIDMDKAMEFFGIIETKLSEINEERFPLILYIDYDDYQENTPKELLA